MKNILVKAFGALFLVLVIACNQSAQKPEVITDTPATMNNETEASLNIDVAKLASAKDAVCGMSLKGGVNDTASYQGKLYGFCSKECKDEFVKNPTEYLK